MSSRSASPNLEVFFAPHEVESRLRIHVALDVQCRTEYFRTTEEDACFCWCVDLPDGLEDHIPVRTAEICGCSKTGDGILLSVGVVNHDIRCIVCFDLGRKIL